jgi:hypothetical protein
VLCRKIVSETDERIDVEDYVVVNGAQSLTSLIAEKSKITEELKILVKLIETKGDTALSQNDHDQQQQSKRDQGARSEAQILLP